VAQGNGRCRVAPLHARPLVLLEDEAQSVAHFAADAELFGDDDLDDGGEGDGEPPEEGGREAAGIVGGEEEVNEEEGEREVEDVGRFADEVEEVQDPAALSVGDPECGASALYQRRHDPADGDGPTSHGRARFKQRRHPILVQY
jgi:hypothetical protein